MPEKKVRIVLVRPKTGENIGAVCRAMKTMGLSRLWIVGSPPANRQGAEALACHARDVLDSAVYTQGLAAALEGCVFTAGITARSGARRKYLSYTPEELAAKVHALASDWAALVFGNEESGLTDAELGLCHTSCRIPSSPHCPSLNLSHAVQIIAYALFTFSDPNPRFTPLGAAELDDLTQGITDTLKELGFFKLVGPASLRIFWRDIFARAQLF